MSRSRTRRRKRINKHALSLDKERWLVSYADFITLLFAFFVVMYAISSINLDKYRDLAETLKTALPKTTVQITQKPKTRSTLSNNAYEHAKTLFRCGNDFETVIEQCGISASEAKLLQHLAIKESA